MKKKKGLDRTLFIIDCILITISIIIVTFYLTQAYHDKKYGCNDKWDEENKVFYSSDCIEECGCHTIATYELIIPLNETEGAINDIIKNITENEYG